jgi:hypothetical protein
MRKKVVLSSTCMSKATRSGASIALRGETAGVFGCFACQLAVGGDLRQRIHTKASTQASNSRGSYPVTENDRRGLNCWPLRAAYR